jgi:hypothetical protein
MAVLGDLVLQTANSPGTGTFSLIAPPTGRVSWMTGCGVGAGRFYYAHDGTNWEVGNGTVTSGSPDTLSRDTVYRNSLGTTAKINFTGAVNTYNDIPSDRAFWADASGVYQAQSRRIAALAQGTSQTDAARLDQVGWQQIGANQAGAGVLAVGWSFPAGYTRFRIEWEGLSGGSGAGNFYSQVSTNSGATYDGTSTSYLCASNTTSTSASLTYASSTSGFIVLGQSGVQSNAGWFEFCPPNKRGRWQNWNNSATAVIMTDGVCFYNPSSTPTNILLGLAGNFTSGAARLLGWV